MPWFFTLISNALRFVATPLLVFDLLFGMGLLAAELGVWAGFVAIVLATFLLGFETVLPRFVDFSRFPRQLFLFRVIAFVLGLAGFYLVLTTPWLQENRLAWRAGDSLIQELCEGHLPEDHPMLDEESPAPNEIARVWDAETEHSRAFACEANEPRRRLPRPPTDGPHAGTGWYCGTRGLLKICVEQKGSQTFVLRHFGN